MADLTDLQKALRRNIERVPEFIKDTMQTIGVELEPFITENFQPRVEISPDERAELSKTPNTTNQLRIVSGALTKSLLPNGKGYASGYEVKGGGVYSWVVDIDLDVIPYARVHELGPNARPYIAPGIKEYGEDRLDDVIDAFYERLLNF